MSSWTYFRLYGPADDPQRAYIALLNEVISPFVTEKAERLEAILYTFYFPDPDDEAGCAPPDPMPWPQAFIRFRYRSSDDDVDLLSAAFSERAQASAALTHLKACPYDVDADVLNGFGTDRTEDVVRAWDSACRFGLAVLGAGGFDPHATAKLIHVISNALTYRVATSHSVSGQSVGTPQVTMTP